MNILVIPNLSVLSGLSDTHQRRIREAAENVGKNTFQMSPATQI